MGKIQINQWNEWNTHNIFFSQTMYLTLATIRTPRDLNCFKDHFKPPSHQANHPWLYTIHNIKEGFPISHYIWFQGLMVI